MKNLYLLIVFVCLYTTSFAQLNADGTTINTTFTITDINSNSYNFKNILDSGKHIIIEFFTAQDAAASWTYDTAHALQKYYVAYGPGTTKADGRVFMYDVDGATTNADIRGTGTHTAGDWTAGNTFPICNETNFSTILSNFISGPATPLPASVVICANSKMYQLSTTLTKAADIRSAVNTFCGINVGINELIEKEFSYEFSPNPVSNELNVTLRLFNEKNSSILITDMLGKTVYRSGERALQPGISTLPINTAAWSCGMYFITMSIGDKTISSKLVVQH